MNSKTIEFAASIGARVVFPTDPKRPVNLYDKTDVSKTWERLRPEPDFVTGEMVEAYANAPESWRMA